MEVLSPFEGLEEGEWISPRISFSQDFQFSGRCSPKMQFKDSPEDEFSFMFWHSSANADLHADDSMLSADELFFDGKVRPLQEDKDYHAMGGCFDQQRVGFERSIQENPRCYSMTIAGARGEGRGGRAYMSLNSSRCSSPSRTMSMPRTTPTSPKHSSTSHRKSSSMLSGRPATLASSEEALASSTLPQLLSSSIPATSAKYSSKLKEFFKLKKANLTKDVSVPSCPMASTSADVSRGSAHASGSASCRLPSRSFWPFSRSNSAGESKTTAAVSPPPRRSNSAGESKTTSCSLLPVNASPTEHDTRKKAPPHVANTTVHEKGMASTSKKGLPPLPNSTSKKTNAFLVAARCGTDGVAVALQSTPVQQAGTSSNRTTGPANSPINSESNPLLSQSNSPTCANESFDCIAERKPGGHIQLAHDARPVARKGKSNTAASPGRPVRRGAHSSVNRNFARASPGRRGAWNSPGRANGGRVSIRNLDRSSLSSKGHVRPKDMLSRDGASGRISPVLNVAVPSLRGSKASSRSKIFRLGHLFSKKDRFTSSQAIDMLPPTDAPNQL